MQVEAIVLVKKATTKKVAVFCSIFKSILQIFLLTPFLFVMLRRKFLIQNDLSELARTLAVKGLVECNKMLKSGLSLDLFISFYI